MMTLAMAVERASGPVAELDTLISRVIGIDLRGSLRRSLRYTASVDAALTLLNGVGVLVELSDIAGDGMPYARVGDCGGRVASGCARTLPLALCAAAIRCRAAQKHSWNVCAPT